jgi:signal transduction histidine kinase
VGKEFAADSARDRLTPLSLRVEGAPRKLQPIVRDEIYWIAREALVNAFRHSGATRIEVELLYDDRHFKLGVRDDGKGIPAEILEPGRTGHYGLTGMRERARQVGAELSIWSRPGSGTEVQLRLAGSIAYGTSRRRRGGAQEVSGSSSDSYREI